MPDIATVYTLTTPGGTITFNNGATDEYYLSEIGGLEDAPIRAPVDNRPQTDGGLVHDFYEGPLHLTLEGILFIRSTRVQNSIRTIRTSMTDNLRTALRSILRADGTLAWTPYGSTARSLTVRYEVPLDPRYIDNYLNVAFSFGLVSASSTPS